MSRLAVAFIVHLLGMFFVVASTPTSAMAQSGALIGTVVNKQTSAPIYGALVFVVGGRQVRTDSLGRLGLERLSAGPYALSVQAVGYIPLRAAINLAADSTIEVDVELDAAPAELSRVVTTADRVDARNVNYPEFERRRAAGLGRFISREELLRWSGQSFETLLSLRMPGTRVLDVGGKRVLGSSRGRISVIRGDPRCFVQVIVDNVVRYENGGSLPPFDLRSIDPAMIAAVEFYTVSTTPTEFNRGGNAPCGTLLIWMQN
jgi:hypothetical protein